MYSRHGERYPSKSNGKSLEAIYAKFENYKGTFKGDLAFLNDYTYFVTDKNNYEKETSPKILKEPMPVQPMPCVMVLRLEPNMDPYTKKTQLYQSSHQF